MKFVSTWVKEVKCKEQQRGTHLAHHKTENESRGVAVSLFVCFSGPATDDKHGVQFQQIIDWLKEYLRHTFTPLVKAAQEDLYLECVEW